MQCLKQSPRSFSRHVVVFASDGDNLMQVQGKTIAITRPADAMEFISLMESHGGCHTFENHRGCS